MIKKPVNYLTIAQILAIHDLMIKNFGGSFGIRDMGLIESSVARPKASFDGQDLYLDVFTKAAALLQSLLKNHPFIDGNKRTAFTSAAIFLKLNGWRLVNKHQESVKFAISVDNNHLRVEQISDWLKTNSTKL